MGDTKTLAGDGPPTGREWTTHLKNVASLEGRIEKRLVRIEDRMFKIGLGVLITLLGTVINIIIAVQ